MSKTIYVVTKGEYSEYDIRAVFDEEALAKRLAAVIDGNVERWALNPKEAAIREGLLPYRVAVTRDGNLVLWAVRASWISLQEAWGHWSGWGYANKENPYVFISECWARDEEHAVKIANDRRVQSIARGEMKG